MSESPSSAHYTAVYGFFISDQKDADARTSVSELVMAMANVFKLHPANDFDTLRLYKLAGGDQTKEVAEGVKKYIHSKGFVGRKLFVVCYFGHGVFSQGALWGISTTQTPKSEMNLEEVFDFARYCSNADVLCVLERCDGGKINLSPAFTPQEKSILATPNQKCEIIAAGEGDITFPEGCEGFITRFSKHLSSLKSSTTVEECVAAVSSAEYEWAPGFYRLVHGNESIVLQPKEG